MTPGAQPTEGWAPFKIPCRFLLDGDELDSAGSAGGLKGFFFVLAVAARSSLASWPPRSNLSFQVYCVWPEAAAEGAFLSSVERPM